MNVSHFPIGKIAAIRNKARCAGQSDFKESAPEPSPSDVVAAFPDLRISPGWTLTAHFAGDQLGHESRVLAAPPAGEAERLSDIRPAERPGYFAGMLDDLFEIPPTATGRFMRAIAGVDSPWSYLCASLLLRELVDFGAFWHALYEHDWFEHTILAGWPPPQRVLLERRQACAGDEWRHLDIKWLEEPPKRWRPEVVVDATGVTVRFFSYRPPGANSEEVWRHEDHYEAGCYDPRPSKTLIATGLARCICY